LSGLLCDIEVQDAPTIVTDDEEAISALKVIAEQ